MPRLFEEMFLVWRDLLGPWVPVDRRSWRWDLDEGHFDDEYCRDERCRDAYYEDEYHDDYTAPRAAAARAPRERARVTFDVAASQRVEVTLDLDLDEDLTRLTVLALTGSDEVNRGASPIHDARLERTREGEREVVVRLTVPTGQPSGNYSGMIVDRARAVIAGSVRVCVHA